MPKKFELCPNCLGTKSTFNGRDYDYCTICDDEGRVDIQEEYPEDYIDNDYDDRF